MGDSIYGYDSPEGNVSLNRASISRQGELITSSGLFSERIEVASATATYIGHAKPGTAESTAAWRIKRVATSGSATLIGWADGDTLFDNTWDSRASKTYS